MIKRALVIIPGIGDRQWLYKLYALLWKRMGYDTYIYAFRWADNSKMYNKKMKYLYAWLDSLQASNLNVIGISAGGTIGVNVLMERPRLIHRVVTICTPYDFIPSLRNNLLNCSIRKAQLSLSLMDDKMKNRLVSVHGIYDQKVPIRSSRPGGVRVMRIPAVGHGITIFFTLVIFYKRLTTLLLEYN